MCLTEYCASLIILLFIIELSPIILDFVLPLDEPRVLKPIVTVKHFIIQDDQIYIAIFNESVVVVILAAIISSTSATLLLFTLHSFGMFKIAR